MGEVSMDQVKEKIIQHLQRAKKGISRDIAKATGFEKRTVDKAVSELINDEKLVYVNYGGITYLALPGETREGASVG